MAGLSGVGVLDAAPDPVEGSDCGQINMNGLDMLLGYNLGTAYAALSFDLDPALRLIELTPKQTSILWLVEVNPGITQSQLARMFRMRRATIHQMIASLTRKDLLRLESIESDRRAQGLFITDAGLQKLAEARACVFSMENAFSNVLTDAEFRMALQILQKLQGAMRGG
ncbi:MarR family winged helix-turn-helix transcriptional regulator [Novosphingobium ovatum]|nr:MarR family winged helix-turn-helix transcriptional regulator [Novosphingobium ovatum]